MAIIELAIWQWFVPVEYIGIQPVFIAITDTLELSDTISTNQHVETINQKLPLRSTPHYTYGLVEFTFTDQLGVTDQLHPVIEQQLTHNLILTQDIIFPQHITLSHLFRPVQYIHHSIGRTIHTITDTLTITQNLGVLRYHPSGTGSVGGPLFTADNKDCQPEQQSFVQFVDSKSLTVTLPRPDFGDTDSYEQNRINRRSRDLSLIIKSYSYWPKSRTFKLTFSTLTDDLKSQLVIFHRKNYGKLVNYTDLEGVVHHVVITNNELQFEEERNCAWKTSVDLLKASY